MQAQRYTFYLYFFMCLFVLVFWTSLKRVLRMLFTHQSSLRRLNVSFIYCDRIWLIFKLEKWAHFDVVEMEGYTGGYWSLFVPLWCCCRRQLLSCYDIFHFRTWEIKRPLVMTAEKEMFMSRECNRRPVHLWRVTRSFMYLKIWFFQWELKQSRSTSSLVIVGSA